MSAQNFSPNDPELDQARDQGRGIPWKELFLALACFYGTLLWANSVGGWIKLSRRIARYIQRRRLAKENLQIKRMNPTNEQPT